MDRSILHKAYDAKQFRSIGHQLIDILADHLANIEEAEKCNHWANPNEEFTFWEAFAQEEHDAISTMKTILDRSIHIHHPRYIGHQVVPTAPITALSSILSALLNNGMAIYEMGAVPSAMERYAVKHMCQKIGYQDGDGVLTSGGTLGNLTALLCARQVMIDRDVWNEGSPNQLAIMVSEEAHYCVDRAAKIMGLGSQGVIKIPVDDEYKMKTELLQAYYDKATEEGIQVFAIVASAPSTSTGIYDDLKGIAAFSQRNNLWMHVDGAHGGAAVYSDKYKHYLSGIEQANSVIIDAHKMLLNPALSTFVCFRDTRHSYQTFNQKAQYLWSQDEQPEWYNYGKRTFECTKRMMSIHYYLLLQIYGEVLFSEFVTRQYELGHKFARLIKDSEDFELAVEVHSNIVCFRYAPDGVSQDRLDGLNDNIRQVLLEDGVFYIVKTKLKGVTYLRVSIMNPQTTIEHLSELLMTIREKAALL